VVLFANLFPGGGSPIADVFAIVVSVILFAFCYWAIDLIDRI
jgi:preprotein translocase subunit SecE